MWLAFLFACWGDNAYIVTGTVVAVNGPSEVVIDHEAIPALHMDAMAMPFPVKDPSLLAGVQPGDHVVARMMIEQDGEFLTALRVDGHGLLPTAPPQEGPIRAGEVLPALTVPLSDGTSMAIGAGHGPLAIAFLYTRCPLPDYCPATVARLQQLQERDVDILAVTLDPDHDTPDVLHDFAAQVGAKPAWRFGRLSHADLDKLAAESALTVAPDGEKIVHGLRLLVLDKDGRLVERYDDNRWPVDRVATQLRTGGPPAPPGSDGTLTP